MLDLIHLSATFSIGILGGALLTEACILVPYWRRMDPSDFLRLHGEMGPSLFRYFAPLTVIAVALPVCSGLLELANAGATNGRILAGGLSLAALMIFFIYFKKANAKFAAHSIPENALADELARWASWHWARTILVLIAFAFSIIGTI